MIRQRILVVSLFLISIFNYWNARRISWYHNTEEEEEDHISKEEVPTADGDYCSKDGSVCVYHNICYDIGGGLWHASVDPKHYPLLNDDNFTSTSHSRKLVFSRCNERFTPISNGTFTINEKDMVYFEGITYFVCCWTNHFGHILVQMMTSTIHALVKMGFENVFRSGSVQFLVDNRAPSNHGSERTAWSVFEFITGDAHKVFSLQNLEHRAKARNRNNLCFERLVVGMRFTDLAYSRFDNNFAPEVEVGMLNPLRNYLNEFYPSTREAVELALSQTQTASSRKETKSLGLEHRPPECTLTFLQRKQMIGKPLVRAINNLDEVMNVTKMIFHESKWNIQRVSFDGPPLKSQYLTVRNTMLFVSASGTGSHLAMFLPEGAVSIEILYNNTLSIVNADICAVIPGLTCLSSKGKCPAERPRPNDDCKLKNVKVDLESFTEAIKVAKTKMSNNCDMAIANKK